MKCAIPWCPSDAVSGAWIERSCPQQSAQTKLAILSSGLCAMHVQQRFGHDVVRRGRGVEVKLISSVDGTLDDEKARR